MRKPTYEVREVQPDFDTESDLDDAPDAVPMIMPVEDDRMATALAPVYKKRGRQRPGTFRYTPDELYDMFYRYVTDFMPKRMLYRREMLKGGPSAGSTVEIEMQAPMSQETFCLYCSMWPSTYVGYRKRADYKDVVELIDSAILANNYEMGATGLIHAGLVARKHGMAEHTDVQSNGKEIAVVPIQFSFSRKSLEGTLNKSLDAFDEMK